MTMTEEIIARLTEKGYKAEIQMIQKNGTEYVGVAMGEGNIRPVINIDFYLKSMVDSSLIVEEIVDIYEHANTPKYDIKLYSSWGYAKDHMILCVQRKTDEDVLKWDYLDLEMYARVIIADNGDSTMSYKVRRGMFKNVDDGEILVRATAGMIKNTWTSDAISIFKEVEDNYHMDMSLEIPPMIVASNKDKTFGAGVMCNKDLLAEISKKYDSDLFILPSSIHEIIIVPCGDGILDVDSLTGLICEVNAESVMPEERLRDHPYIYHKETEEIDW